MPDDGDEARGGIRSSDDITRDELRRAMAARGDVSSSGGSGDADDGDAAGTNATEINGTAVRRALLGTRRGELLGETEETIREVREWTERFT